VHHKDLYDAEKDKSTGGIRGGNDSEPAILVLESYELESP
jgi:hypothetical protein